jgi:hypothetical protein
VKNFGTGLVDVEKTKFYLILLVFVHKMCY